jgi:competence protein ComEC
MSSDARSKGQELRNLHLIDTLLEGQRGHLFPWAAVFIGLGAGLWFSLPQEPGAVDYAVAALVLAFGVAMRIAGPERAHPVAVGLACLAAGVLAAGLRVQMVAAPMLDFRYYGPVQGRIVWIDRSQSDVLRLTLDRVVLERTAPQRTPARVRVSLHGSQTYHEPKAGQTVILTAHLSAPDGPVEPGSFDFRRMAFFEGLGAVGYTRSPVLLWHPPVKGSQIVDRMRSHLASAMLHAMPSEAGAFATGAMTGDRSAISQETAAALRDSGLAHLLAISGMNLAFLIAFVFALIRYGVALIPPLALRVSAKKIAALVSLGVAFFYLLLSGSNVATERAFIMVTVMLGAVLLDRRALTLRSVALAGIILILWKPESLLAPGFQMSFAATTALIAGFAAMQDRMAPGRIPRWVLPLVTLVMSSVIGGLASGPYAAASFNRYADYGLLANLLTVPVMGAVVMPAGALAALLAPVGLSAIPLWVMEAGSAWILHVAYGVAGMEGAVTGIASPPASALPLITMGMLWLILWQGRLRIAGLAPVVLGLWVWSDAPRPALLVARDGSLIGAMGPEGRVLSQDRGAGFAARSWLENDGDLAATEVAASRAGFTGPPTARQLTLGSIRIVALSGKAGLAQLETACAMADLIILAAPQPETPQRQASRACRVMDQTLLARTGPLAFWPEGEGLRIQATESASRRWSRPSGAEALPQGALAPVLPSQSIISAQSQKM